MSSRKVISKQCSDYASLQIKNKELEAINSRLSASSSTFSNCNILKKKNVDKLKTTLSKLTMGGDILNAILGQ